MSYDSLYEVISRRFGFRQSDDIRLQYSLPGCDVCFLETQVDLQMLFSGANIYNLKCVEISVCKVIGDLRICSVIDSCSVPDEDDFLGLPYRSESQRIFLSDEWTSYITCVGHKFMGGALEFRDKLKKYAIGVGFEYNYVRNDGVRVSVICGTVDNEVGTEPCHWFIKGSEAACNKSFYIHEMDNVHTCKGVMRRLTHRMLDSDVVTSCIETDIMYNWSIRPNDIISKFKSAYGFDITYRVALKAKQKAKDRLFGNDAHSFHKLRWYKDAVMETNTGSYFELEVDKETNRFKRLFLAYGGCIEGFQFCLPVLYVDGTFGKSVYKGQILAATGRNGNKGNITGAVIYITTPVIWITTSDNPVLCISYPVILITTPVINITHPVINITGSSNVYYLPGYPHSFFFLFYFAGMYPLAICVCDSESEDNWYFFFWHLRIMLERHKRVVTFISDRGVGLLSAFDKVFPGNPHLFCYKHLTMNLSKRYAGKGNSVAIQKIRTCFFKLAYSSSEMEYRFNLRSLREEGRPEIIDSFLSEIPVEHWCRAFFKGSRYGIMANGIAESFNNWISVERAMPVYCLLEQTRRKVMEMNAGRRAESLSWTTRLTPEMEEKLKIEMDKSRRFSVHNSSPGEYEVRSEFFYSVNLNDRTCSCVKWQINCFPCPHALAAIQKHPNGDVYDYVDFHFHVEPFRKSYGYPVCPISNVDEPISRCGSDYILPPTAKRPPGRRRNKRIKSSGEVVKKQITCGRCGRKGNHNMLTCTESINY